MNITEILPFLIPLAAAQFALLGYVLWHIFAPFGPMLFASYSEGTTVYDSIGFLMAQRSSGP